MGSYLEKFRIVPCLIIEYSLLMICVYKYCCAVWSGSFFYIRNMSTTLFFQSKCRRLESNYWTQGKVSLLYLYVSSETDRCTAVDKCELWGKIGDFLAFDLLESTFLMFFTVLRVKGSEEFCQMPQHAYHLIGRFLPTIALVPASYIENDLEVRDRISITIM